MKTRPKFQQGEPVTWVDDAEGVMRRYVGRVATWDEEEGFRAYLIHKGGQQMDFVDGIMAKEQEAPFALVTEDELESLLRKDD